MRSTVTNSSFFLWLLCSMSHESSRSTLFLPPCSVQQEADHQQAPLSCGFQLGIIQREASAGTWRTGGGKVEIIIFAPSPDLCVLVAPARGIFSIRLSIPKYPSVTSNLGMETAPCFANPGVLNCLLLVSGSTIHSLVSGPLIKLPSIYPKRMCF